MAVRTNIFEQEEGWKGPIAASAMFHALLFSSVIFLSAYYGRAGDDWGGTSTNAGAMSATLVSSAIPLPSQPAPEENVLATESKGLSESVPAETKTEPEAIPIPDKTVKMKKVEPVRTPTKEKPIAPPKPTNQVPFGQGGPVSAPMSVFKTELGSGGVSMDAGGSFGSRYSWYVDAVRRKISENWLKYEVDPSIKSASRVYVTFEIGRDGSPGNIQISQSSGVPSLDMSAKRALQRIDTFGPLPPDYNGGRVNVEFWFDFKR
jgi:protein TonB